MRNSDETGCRNARVRGRGVWAIVFLAAAAASGAACRATTPAATQPEYTPTATVKDIMQFVIDPSADVVWNAVHTVVTPDGMQEIEPVTDEDWINTRAGAIRLVEATNLLIVPGRRVARAGEKSEAPGVELE